MVAPVNQRGITISAMTLHCGLRKDITLLRFRRSEPLEHTFLASFCVKDDAKNVTMSFTNIHSGR
jgi:hypothetical protein